MELCRIFPKSYNPIIYIVLYSGDNKPYTIYVYFVSVIIESNTYEHIKQSMVLQLVSHAVILSQGANLYYFLNHIQ